jgi:hypothetical protein
MKSTKIFFLYIVALTAALFSFEMGKGFLFSGDHYYLVTIIKISFFIISALIVMWYTLDADSFKRFILFYPAIIIIYFIIKYIEIKILDMPHPINLEGFIYVIPLFTPLPLIFFWILNKALFVKNDYQK